ncbi:MAG TPA: FAD-binding oxidoreductase [Solirubrobacteraceae bacterium]|nr:FAD-binding oxidoreductase [Solirubrobacteraceae bacterium]
MSTTAPRLQLLEPGHPLYEETCRLHNAMHVRRPAYVARCASPADVAEALRFAREQGLPVSVRGGGHHVAGHAVVDRGLVIDPAPMDAVAVDPAARTVRVGGGVRWGALDAATQEYGLAVTGGRDSTTGVAGQALGSGSGWLERRLGLTGDNLLAVELVTADGRFVRAAPDSEPELFWALRGAGANFGVVTALELRLHPVGPVVYGGILMFDAADRAAVLRGWREANDAADLALGTAPALITAPPAPFVPEHLRGRRAVGMFVCWSGDPAAGEEACAPLRAIAPPAVDLVGPMPYNEVQQLVEPTTPWGRREYWKAENLAALTDAAIDTLVAFHDRCPSPFTAVVIEPKLGAIARLPEDATAVGARDAAHTWYAFGGWEDPADDEANIAWTRELAAAMAPFGMPAIALNFIDGDEAGRERRAFGEAKFARLRRVKRAWDPENVFRSCANVAP